MHLIHVPLPVYSPEHSLGSLRPAFPTSGAPRPALLCTTQCVVQCALHARKTTRSVHSDAGIHPSFLCSPLSFTDYLASHPLLPHPPSHPFPSPPLPTARACYTLSGELQDLLHSHGRVHSSLDFHLRSLSSYTNNLPAPPPSPLCVHSPPSLPTQGRLHHIWRAAGPVHPDARVGGGLCPRLLQRRSRPHDRCPPLVRRRHRGRVSAGLHEMWVGAATRRCLLCTCVRL